MIPRKLRLKYEGAIYHPPSPRNIPGWLGPQVLKHTMICMAVGEKTIEDALDNYDRHRNAYSDFSQIKKFRLLSRRERLRNQPSAGTTDLHLKI